MQDAWRAYLELAFGLTEASRRKARAVAGEVLGKSEATAAQVQSFVDELVSTSRINREGLARLVRYEVDRALGAVGLATADEVADLTSRLRDLERRLNESAAGAVPPVATVPPQGEAENAAATPGGTKTVAQKAVTKSPGGNNSVAKNPVAKKAVAKKAVAKKAVAKKATPKTTARKGAG